MSANAQTPKCRCQNCKKPLLIQVQQGCRRTLLQMECKTPDCLLFEKTVFVESVEQYQATDYVAKWTPKVV